MRFSDLNASISFDVNSSEWCVCNNVNIEYAIGPFAEMKLRMNAIPVKSHIIVNCKESTKSVFRNDKKNPNHYGLSNNGEKWIYKINAVNRNANRLAFLFFSYF